MTQKLLLRATEAVIIGLFLVIVDVLLFVGGYLEAPVALTLVVCSALPAAMGAIILWAEKPGKGVFDWYY